MASRQEAEKAVREYAGQELKAGTYTIVDGRRRTLAGRPPERFPGGRSGGLHSSGGRGVLHRGVQTHGQRDVLALLTLRPGIAAPKGQLPRPPF